MPTYDYKCNACSHTFEQHQSMKDKTLRKCPKCGKSALERLIGVGAAVIFKGSGFYQTDYRSESYKKSADADKKPSESGSGGDAKVSEAKTGDAAPKPDAPGKAEPAKKPEPAKPAADAKPSGESKSKKDKGGKKGG